MGYCLDGRSETAGYFTVFFISVSDISTFLMKTPIPMAYCQVLNSDRRHINRVLHCIHLLQYTLDMFSLYFKWHWKHMAKQTINILWPHHRYSSTSSSMVRVFAYGAMCHWINPSWWIHWAISHSSHCSTTGVTKAVYVLFCLWDEACKRTLAANRKE